MTTPACRFEQTWCASEPALVRLSRSLAARYSLDDDLLQETRIQCWRKFALYDETRPFTAWACSVMRRLWATAAARARPHLSLHTVIASLDHDVVYLVDKLAQEVASVGDKTLVMAETLEALLPSLTPAQVAALRFAYVLDLDSAQSAREFGLTTKSFYCLLRRARNALRKEYARLVNDL